MKIDWVCKPFKDLTAEQLYAILQLRNEIFVVEQNCVFQDADGKDLSCHHLMGWHHKKLIAYARLMDSGISYPTAASIGRVVVKERFRKKEIGKQLMQQAIQLCYALFGIPKIKIGAQVYLKKFYEYYGFVQSSEAYDEDGIDHIEMLKTLYD